MRKYIKLIVCLLVVLALWAMPYKIIVVKGESMYPYLKNNELLLAVKSNNFSVNDIVIMKNDYDEIIIKRIKFTGNDVYYYLMYSHSDKVEVFDQHIGVMVKKYYEGNHNFLVMKNVVPKGHVFLLGDNSENSDDSRRFGTVKKSDIMYKVISK
jgi:signal peptidase I